MEISILTVCVIVAVYVVSCFFRGAKMGSLKVTEFGFSKEFNKETVTKNMKNYATLFKSPTPFAPGDKVTAFGNTGTVKRISPNNLYVEVNFPEFDSIVTFHLDGKQSQWHKKPSLRKV